MSLEIDTNVAQVAVNYRKATNVTAATLLRTMQKIGTVLDRHVLTEHLRAGRYPSRAAGGRLNYRTGSLGRALYHLVEVFQAAKEVVLRVGVNHAKAVYGRLHEFGGVIRPVKRRALTIPLPAAMTASGVTRWSARELKDNPGSGGFKTTFLLKRPGKDPIVMGVRGRGRTLVPLFVLKKETRLQPVGFMAKSLQERSAWIHEVMGEAAADVAGALGGN